MKVAIDGPAGSGKSTVAKALSSRLGFVMLDTGAMYRAVTNACLVDGVDIDDAQAVAEVAKTMELSFAVGSDGGQTVFANGEDVTRAIRTPRVDANVSAVSAIPEVREAMVALQREMGDAGDVVAEGRDIGTVVFPDAEVKVFMTADSEARALRRAVQRAGGDMATDSDAQTSAEEQRAVLEELERRDQLDSSREVSPLRPAEDAQHIDSSNMTVDEVVDAIAALVDQARANQEPGSSGTVAQDDAVPEPTSDAPKVDEPEAKNGKVGETKMMADDPDAHEAKGDGKKPEKAKKPKLKEPEDFYEVSIRDFPLRARMLLGASIGVCAALSKVFWHWRLEGGKKLWNADGGRMVVMNHVSMLDPVAIVVSDWAHGRRMRPIYKSEFDNNKFVSWFFSRIGAIPVTRGTADIKAVRRAQRALQRGEDVLVFPEGTRIKSEDQEVTIHGGFALIAQLAKVPVIPIAIVGARDGAPGGNKPLKPGRVYMRVGDPITFEELGVKGRKKQAKEMERVAMERVYELRDQLRSEHPGKM